MGDLLSLLNRRSVALFSSKASSTLSLSTTLLHAAHYRNTEIYGWIISLEEMFLIWNFNSILCFMFQQLVKSLRDWFAEVRNTIKRDNGKSDSRFGLLPGSISLCAHQNHRRHCRLRLETTRTSGSLNHHQCLRTLFQFRIQYQGSWSSSSSHLKVTWTVSSHPLRFLQPQSLSVFICSFPRLTGRNMDCLVCLSWKPV